MLLTAWPLLRDNWLEKNRTDRIVRTRLRAACAEWERHDRDSAYLYTGSLLETADTTDEGSRAESARFAPLTAGERSFLAASRRARRHRARIRQGVTAALAALAVGLAAITVLAVGQRDTAVSERNAAASNALADQSEATGASDPVLARLEAAAAWRLHPSARARYAMLSAAVIPWTTVLTDHTVNQEYSAAISPSGTLLATGTRDGTQLWNLTTRELVATLVPGIRTLHGVTLPEPLPNPPVQAVAFSPNGTLLAAGTGDGTHLWNLTTRKLVATLPTGGSNAVNAVAFSPDGKLLAANTDDGTELWNVAARGLVRTLPASTGNSADSVAFNPHGTLLAAGTANGTWLADLTNSVIPSPLPASTGDSVDSVAFSPDNKLLAADLGDATGLWDLGTRKLVTTLPTRTGPVDAVAFSPDGTLLAVGARYHDAVQLWDVIARRAVTTLPTSPADSPRTVAFSPDGTLLAAGTTITAACAGGRRRSRTGAGRPARVPQASPSAGRRGRRGR